VNANFWMSGLGHLVVSMAVLATAYAAAEVLGPTLVGLFVPGHAG
jgi:hypothetical protein